MQIDINRQKVSRHFNLACFSISADRAPLKQSILSHRHGLLAPEESSSKLENQFPCSQKHSYYTLQDLKTCLYLKLFWNFMSERPRQPPKHNSWNKCIQKLIFAKNLGLNFHSNNRQILDRLTADETIYLVALGVAFEEEKESGRRMMERRKRLPFVSIIKKLKTFA